MTRPLSPREIEVLHAYAVTGSLKLVALRLGIARKTALRHVENARSKLGARTTIQAVWLARFVIEHELAMGTFASLPPGDAQLR